METLVYKSKGDHARSLLFEGKSTTEAAEISGLAKGSVDMYFYKLKGKNELSGTPEHPEQTTKSPRALKILQDKRVYKKEKPAKTPKPAEKPKETPPVSPSELANLAGDIADTIERQKQKQQEAKPNLEPVTAETMAEMAAGLADTIARQKQKQQDASAPNVQASLNQTLANNVKAVSTPRPMNLQQIERSAKELTKRPDKIVQRMIRLLRDNCVVSGVARTLEMPEQIVQDVQGMLIANNLMHSSEKRGAPKKNKASQTEALRTAPVPGVPYSKQLTIEKKLMQRISSERISKDLKFSHEYVRKIALQLIKGNHIKPTLKDVYGEATIQEVHVMLLQNKSPLLIANLLQVPVEVVEDLAEKPVEGPFHEERSAEAPKNTDPKLVARRLFLEGMNAVTIAQQLPLSFEEVVAVFKDLSQEGLIAGTAHAPLSPESLENEKAAPVAPTKEPKFVDEEFADVHGVKHQQIALADESVEEVTFDESIERGLIPEEIEVEPTPAPANDVEHVETTRVVTLEESVEEGLVPAELEVEFSEEPAKEIVVPDEDPKTRVTDLIGNDAILFEFFKEHAPLTAKQFEMLLASDRCDQTMKLVADFLQDVIDGDIFRTELETLFPLGERKHDEEMTMRKVQLSLEQSLDIAFVADEYDYPLYKIAKLNEEITKRSTTGVPITLEKDRLVERAQNRNFLEEWKKEVPMPVNLALSTRSKAGATQAEDAPNWKQQLGEQLKEERLANKAERYDTPALTSQAFLAVAKHEDARFLKMADAMHATSEAPFLKDPAEAQREEQLQTELDKFYLGDKDGDHMEQETINPEEQQQEGMMLDISLTPTTTVALLKEKLDEHAVLTDGQIKELQTETIVEPFDDFVLRVLKTEDVEAFRDGLRKRLTLALPSLTDVEKKARATQDLLKNYPNEMIADQSGVPLFDVIDMKAELQPEIIAQRENGQRIQEAIHKGDATLNLYRNYLTSQQYDTLLRDTEFLQVINDAKAHPMIVIAVRLMKPNVNLEMYELDNLLDIFRSLSKNALHRGDFAKDIANDLNIPLLFITLFQEVAEDFKLDDIVAEPNGTLHEAVVQTTLAALERRKSREHEEKRIQERQAFGKIEFQGETINSLDFSSNEATVVPEMPEYIGFDYEPVAIPTRLSFGRKAVSVATVRKHVMKMLDMIELSGNANVDVEFKLSGGHDDERTDV